MIYMPEVKKRIQALFPGFLQRQLCDEEIQELHTLIDDVVRESRETRSTFVNENDRPENFLIELFQPLIKGAVDKFFNRYATVLRKQAKIESSKLKKIWEKTPTHREWTHYATFITRALILGDSTERGDRREEIQPFLDTFIRGEDRQLTLSNLKARARLKECLGQSIKDHEFFVNPLPWAEQSATSEESKCYNPDYNKEKREDLELQKEEASDLIARWEKGEFRDRFGIRSELVKYIDSYCIDTPFEELDERIAETEQNTHLIGYLFGNKEKNGYLYWRLRDFFKYQNRTSERSTAYIPMDEFDNDGESSLDLMMKMENISENELREEEESQEYNPDNIRKLRSLGLTEKQSEVFVLHYCEKFSFHDIGNQLGMSRQNAHRLYQKARRKILSKPA